MRYIVNPQKFRLALAKLRLTFDDAAIQLRMTVPDVKEFASRPHYVYDNRAADFIKFFGTDVAEFDEGNRTLCKSDLIRAVQASTSLTKPDAAAIVNLVFSEMKNALTHGRKVQIADFGAFTVKSRVARLGTNPRTGETINLPETRHVHFKQGEILARLLNGDDDYVD